MQIIGEFDKRVPKLKLLLMSKWGRRLDGDGWGHVSEQKYFVILITAMDIVVFYS